MLKPLGMILEIVGACSVVKGKKKVKKRPTLTL